LPQTFSIWTHRYSCDAPCDANSLRGRFGAALRRIDRSAYDAFFAPERADGPSGLKNPPRPFVFRPRDTSFGISFFAAPQDPVLAACLTLGRELEQRYFQIPLQPSAASRIRVHFVTPTELKGETDQPAFAVLFARIRDRISTLRALYQDGPLEIDFHALADRAALIRTIRCDLQHIAAQRTSRATGQTHSLGGFTGIAEYEGDLGEFLPYLEIAHWTGVGRQTVWGKGEIAVEAF
jgi:hypothetical protein